MPARAIDSYSADDLEREKPGDPSSAMDVLRIGPVVGVGLPNLMSFGGMLKITRYFGAGVNVGLIPTVKLSYYGDATLSYSEADVYGRLFPFGNAFFVGAGIGYVTVSGTMADSVSTAQFGVAGGSVDLSCAASVRTMIFAPQLGLLKTWASGFSLGIDAGVQIPVAPSQVDSQDPTFTPHGLPAVLVQQLGTQVQSYVNTNQQKALETLQTVGRSVLPTVNLRVGWLL